MKITLEKLIMSIEPLQKLFNEPLPIKTTFRLKKITQELDANLRTYNESRDMLLKKYGELKDDIYSVSPDKQEELDNEHRELLDSEITLGFEPISVNILGDIQISSKDLVLLDWLIVE